jgi:hypothetical protein
MFKDLGLSPKIIQGKRIRHKLLGCQGKPLFKCKSFSSVSSQFSFFMQWIIIDQINISNDYIIVGTTNNSIISFDLSEFNNITIIGESAFKDHQYLTTAILPNSIIEIQKYSFYNCSSLRFLTFQNKIHSSSDIFRISSDLQEISFPVSLKNIGEFAFPSPRGSFR